MARKPFFAYPVISTRAGSPLFISKSSISQVFKIPRNRIKFLNLTPSENLFQQQLWASTIFLFRCVLSPSGMIPFDSKKKRKKRKEKKHQKWMRTMRPQGFSPGISNGFLPKMQVMWDGIRLQGMYDQITIWWRLNMECGTDLSHLRHVTRRSILNRILDNFSSCPLRQTIQKLAVVSIMAAKKIRY